MIVSEVQDAFLRLSTNNEMAKGVEQLDLRFVMFNEEELACGIEFQKNVLAVAIQDEIKSGIGKR